MSTRRPSFSAGSPTSRDFPLSDLIVLTAQTGDEFPETGLLVAEHVMPLLRANAIRTVQIARATASRTDGVAVLSDTRYPVACYTDGRYKLSDELRTAGTVPQVASGRRLCSQKAKGWPLDWWLAANMDGEFRHAIGFAVGEERRRDRDQTFGTGGRQPEYPLIDWGWDRDQAIDYIADVTGVRPWPKSCCFYCPFARDNHLDRYLDEPQLGADALLIEFLSLPAPPCSRRSRSSPSTEEPRPAPSSSGASPSPTTSTPSNGPATTSGASWSARPEPTDPSSLSQPATTSPPDAPCRPSPTSTTPPSSSTSTASTAATSSPAATPCPRSNEPSPSARAGVHKIGPQFPHARARYHNDQPVPTTTEAP